jgi:hypothetical protein
MWSLEQKVYMASMIDGEGSLNIEIQSPRENRKYYYYSLRLIVINTNKDLMDWLVKTFGGKYSERKKIEKRKVCYRWAKCSREAAEILEACIPYMIVKKHQAQLFIEFMNTMGITGWNVSAETREHRQFLYEKMRKLNKQGD